MHRGDRRGDHRGDDRGRSDSNRRFIKPREAFDEVRTGPLILEEREDVSNDAGSAMYNPYSTLGIQQQRARLPIFKSRNHILYMLEKYRVVVLVGETGSGKSTQVPQYLLESGWCSDGRMVAVTQPRRIAAATLAARVAEERSSLLGSEVGYVVRFDEVVSEKTSIKFLTDGILLREMLSDPLLAQYSVIMVDEVHERSMNTDILLGLLRRLLAIRVDLRLIVSSATVDAEVFRDFFEMGDESNSTAAIISVEGRTHPVSVYFTKTGVADYVQATTDTVLSIHAKETVGDILVFLTGMDEVEQVCKSLREEAPKMKNVDKLWVVPCYGGLPGREQMKAFDSSPHGTRKVVVATNIAETSVTIPGIAYVVDCGFVKIRALHPKCHMEMLMRVRVSQGGADQRAGRAGRVRSGKAFRIYPESEYLGMRPHTVPEIQRSHLAPFILQLKALGVHNLHKFHYVSRPPSTSMVSALELLYALGAVDGTSALTQQGIEMAELPLPPMHSKCLLSSGSFGCSEEILTVIAMMQIQDVFTLPSKGRHRAEVEKRRLSVEEGDHITYLNVYTSFVENGSSSKWCADHFVNYRGMQRAVSIRNQLTRMLRKHKVPLVSCRGLIGETERVRRCLVAGFFSQAARYHYTGRYRTVVGEYEFGMNKASAVMYCKDYPQWIIFSEVMQDSLRDVSVIESQWLYELAPNYYQFGTDNEIANEEKRPLDMSSLSELN